MKQQSNPAIAQRRGHLKWMIFAALIFLNLAAYSRAEGSLGSEAVVAPSRQPSSVTLPPHVAFALLVGAGLLVAGKRARNRRSQPAAAVADFEMAFRVQNLPRVRVDETPLYRDRSVCLRKTASRLGCDQ
jgi:hypothetical protein